MSFYTVIVLIPVFNNLKGLKNSINSISSLCHTLYILVVDDGSNPEEAPEDNIFEIYPGQIIRSGKNNGVTAALNQGLRFINEHLNCKYLARLDAGDICINNRFDSQIQHLEANREIKFLGSRGMVYNDSDKLLYYLDFPLNHQELCKKMFINNFFIHPTLLIRWDFLMKVGFYNINFQAAEDYEFCFRMIRRGKGINLPEYHLKKIYDNRSISVRTYKRQVKTRLKVIWTYRAFNKYFFYGLFRNLILLFMPHKFVELVKKLK